MAAAFCSSISAPSCISRYGAFDDEDDFNRCRREMADFEQEVDRFMRCQNDAAQAAIRDAKQENESAISEFNQAVESFNRRAKSN